MLRHLLDFTPGEIADALGLPRGTVNSRLRRGLDGLQDPSTGGPAMSAPDLRERLERAAPPGGRAAQPRAWALVHAALGERTPRRRRPVGQGRRWRWRCSPR